MKNVRLLALFLYLCSTQGIAQSTSNSGSPDIYWQTKPVKNFDSSEGMRAQDPGNKSFYISSLKYTEEYGRQLREWGIEFWRRFPDDSRRFEWFEEAVYNEPSYFKNTLAGVTAIAEGVYGGVIDLDIKAKSAWDSFYVIAKPIYLKTLDERKRKRFLMSELGYRIVRAGAWRNSITDKFDFVTHANSIIDYVRNYLPAGSVSVAKRESPHSYEVPYSCNYPVVYQTYFGLTDDNVWNYLALLKKSGCKPLQSLAAKMEAIMALKVKSFEFISSSVDGKKIDLNDYKGKKVLIDFWSLNCTSCVAKMPEIKNVYERYRSRGFEVISVCIRPVEPGLEKNVLAIHKKIGAEWPLTIIGFNKGELGRVIWDRFGFMGVPQYFLLDEEGKLLHYNGEICEKGGLERLLNKIM